MTGYGKTTKRRACQSTAVVCNGHSLACAPAGRRFPQHAATQDDDTSFWKLGAGMVQVHRQRGGRRSVLGSWVGARRLSYRSLFLRAPRMALPRDPSTDMSALPSVCRTSAGRAEHVGASTSTTTPDSERARRRRARRAGEGSGGRPQEAQPAIFDKLTDAKQYVAGSSPLSLRAAARQSFRADCPRLIS